MNKDAKLIFLTTFLLAMIGVIMTYSSSAVYAYRAYGDSMYFVKRHLIHLMFGVVLAVICMSISVERLRVHARGLFLFFVFFLVIVLIPGLGKEAGGARRWLRVFGFGFQPSEMAKLAMILYIADFTSRKRHVIRDLKTGFIPPLFILGLTSGLILIEPDMGTFVSILFVGFIMLFISGVRIKHLVSMIIGFVPVVIAAILCEPYRIKRIFAVFNPWKDPQGTGFQVIQSLIALGSGGLFGVGLGGSKQKLFYLPESHTDFVFAIIGEELGFFGSGAVIILFAALVFFSLKTSFKIKDHFASRTVFGVGMMIAFEVIVNMGVTMGVLPTKGLALPFISYGGSSLVSHLAAIGIVLNMSRETE